MELRNVVWCHLAMVALALAGVGLAPAATAGSHVRVGVGFSVPGFAVGVGNCYSCAYWNAPRVYVAPPYGGYGYYGAAYPPPVYYLDPPYYMTRPVPPAYGYYGGYYGGYAPYYRSYRYGDGHGWNRGWNGDSRGRDHRGGRDHQGGDHQRGH